MINNRDCLTNRIHVRCLSPAHDIPASMTPPTPTPIIVDFSTLSRPLDKLYRRASQEGFFYSNAQSSFYIELSIAPHKLFDYHYIIAKYSNVIQNNTCNRISLVKYYCQLIAAKKYCERTYILTPAVAYRITSRGGLICLIS